MMRRFVICLTVVSAVLGVTKAADPAFKKVSKTVSLGKYTPKGIVKFNGVSVSKRIIPDLEKLIAAAKKDRLTLKVKSGYRSYDYQVKTFNSWTENERKKNPKLTRKEAEGIANTYSARPGHSEHQLGTTVDVLSSENGFQFSSDPKLKYIAWLEKNAPKYNFTISYPRDSKEYVYEPWHLRWYPPKKIVALAKS